MARRFVLAFSMALVLVGCGGDKPSLEEVGPEAYVAYPDSVEFDRKSRLEETRRIMEGPPICQSTGTRGRYWLAEPIPQEALGDWYTQTLLHGDWERSDTSSLFVAEKVVGGRIHRVRVSSMNADAVRTGEGLSHGYWLSYAIGFDPDHDFCDL